MSKVTAKIKATILVACGTAIATSTVVAEKLKNNLSKYGIEANIIQSKVAEIKYYLKLTTPDVIVYTTPIPKDINIPSVSGHSFLTGIGEEETIKKIVEIIMSKKNK